LAEARDDPRLEIRAAAAAAASPGQVLVDIPRNDIQAPNFCERISLRDGLLCRR